MIASGFTSPFGWLPAEYARKQPAPSLLKMLSARIERAELPVQRNRTLKMRSGAARSGMGGVLGGFTTGDEPVHDRAAHGRVALAAVAHEKFEKAG